MPDLASLELRIQSLEVEVAQKRLGTLDAAAKKTTGTTGALSKAFGRNASTAQQLAAQLGALASVTAALSVAGRITRNVIAFEQGLVGVGKTTNIAGQELERLGRRIRGLSLTIPVAATELLSIAQAAGQLGVTGSNNIVKFTDTVARLGTASDLSGEEAATTLARILNITGEAVGDVDRLGAVIVELGNNFAATEREIAEVGQRIAQATAQFDVSAAQAVALGAAMRSVGIQAELGGTAVGRTFRVLDAAVREGGDRLAEVARIADVTEDTFRRAFRLSSVEGFRLFLEGLGKLVAANRNTTQALENIGLEGERVLAVLPTLAKNTDIVTAAFDRAIPQWEAVTALIEESNRAFDTTGSSLQILSNSFAALGSSLADNLVKGGLRDFVEGMTEATQILGGFKAESDETSAAVHTFVFAFEQLADAIVAVPSLFGPLSQKSRRFEDTAAASAQRTQEVRARREAERRAQLDRERAARSDTFTPFPIQGVAEEAARQAQLEAGNKFFPEIARAFTVAAVDGIRNAQSVELLREVTEFLTPIWSQALRTAVGSAGLALTRDNVARLDQALLEQVQSAQATTTEAIAAEAGRLETVDAFIQSLQEEIRLVGLSNDERQREVILQNARHSGAEQELADIEILIDRLEEAQRLRASQEAAVEAQRRRREEREDLDALAQDLQDEIRLLGLSNDERQRELVLMRARRISADAELGQIKELTERLIEDQRVRRIAEGFSEAFGRAFEDVALGLEDLEDAFERFLRDVQALLLRQLFTIPFTDALTKGLTGLLGGGTTPSTPIDSGGSGISIENGNVNNSATGSTSPINSSSATVGGGRAPITVNQYFSGDLDSFRAGKRQMARDAREIARRLG